MPATLPPRSHTSISHDELAFPIAPIELKQSTTLPCPTTPFDRSLNIVAPSSSQPPCTKAKQYALRIRESDFYTPRRPAPLPPFTFPCKSPALARVAPQGRSGPAAAHTTCARRPQYDAATTQSQAQSQRKPETRPHAQLPKDSTRYYRALSIVPPVPSIPVHLMHPAEAVAPAETEAEAEVQTEVLDQPNHNSSARPDSYYDELPRALASYPVLIEPEHEVASPGSWPAPHTLAHHVAAERTRLGGARACASEDCPTLVPDSPSTVPSIQYAVVVRVPKEKSAVLVRERSWSDGEDDDEEETEDEEEEISEISSESEASEEELEDVSELSEEESDGEEEYDDDEYEDEAYEEAEDRTPSTYDWRAVRHDGGLEETRGRQRTKEFGVVEWMLRCELAKAPAAGGTPGGRRGEALVEREVRVMFREVVW